MADGDIEVVRRSLEHFLAVGEPLWEVTHDEFVVQDHDIMDGQEYRGQEGVRRWLRDWTSAWSEFSMSPMSYLDAGDCVLVIVQMKATGALSGVEVEREDAIVFRLRAGRITQLDYY